MMTVFLLFVLSSCCVSPLIADKRILLSDPDVVLHELSRLRETIDGLNQTVSRLEAQNTKLQNQASKGSTYTIWGRRNCPSTASTLYSGYAAGGYDGDTGSAAESLCLPPDPQFNLTKITGGDHAVIYGAEYYSQHFFRPNGNDVPCSVCHSESTSVLMIPGRYSCYTGWKQEYYGYLASGSHQQVAASSYICIDIEPEDLNSGEKTYPGRWYYPVIADCEPLQCPPYHQNYPLMCVVCSK